jgi:5-methylcytosine-specific restriction enzyme subunit McrC
LNKIKNNRVFQVYEHASYNIKNEGREGKKLPEELFEALKNYAGDKELPYYSITANGIKFKQFVGAIQIGRYCIEVLPKVDRIHEEESAHRILIEMLHQIGYLKITSPTESNLKIKRNFILEAYFQMFLDESFQLIHNGLIKTYHSDEGNQNALKGNLLFSKNILKNNVHAERFFVRYTTYDREHPLNKVLYKTLKLISQIHINSEISERANNQLICFPELPDISVSEEFFERVVWNRKTEAYRKAITIARLLLLNYHPDLSHGKNHVLALMFDMNDIWEKWVTRGLVVASKRLEGNISIKPQTRKVFWTGSNGERVRQIPDMIVEIDGKPWFILDTKWKLVQNRPGEDDIRQMFAYNKLFAAEQAYLIYPGSNKSVHGDFYESHMNGRCGLRFLGFIKDGRLSNAELSDFLNELWELYAFKTRS